MSKKSFHIFNFIIFAVLLLINLLIYFQRDKGFAYLKTFSNDELYHHSGETVLNRIQLNGDTATLYLSGPQAWRDNKNEPYSPTPSFVVMPGKNLYHLHSRRNDKLVVGLNFTPASEYHRHNRRRSNVVELFYSSVLTGQFELMPLSDWLHVPDEISTDEKTQALALISARMHVGPNESSEIKVLKTAGYILSQLDEKRGIPAGFMDTLSPLQRLNAAANNRSGVWCGDFASIFSFFMNMEGVPARLVTMEGRIGDVLLPGHVFNEVYLKEKKTWAIVDLTSKALLVRNPEGKFLNAQELMKAHKISAAGLNITTYSGKLLRDTTYEEVRAFYDYYFQSGETLTYYFRSHFRKESYNTWQKVKRYLLPHPTFAVTEAHTDRNTRFYMKQLAGVLLVLFSLYWLSATIIARKKPAI